MSMYSSICPKCGQVIRVNMQGTEIGSHTCVIKEQVGGDYFLCDHPLLDFNNCHSKRAKLTV